MSAYFINDCILHFNQGVEYEVSAYIYNTSSITDTQFVPEFDFYLTSSISGGQFPFKSWETNTLGKLIAVASTTQSLVPKYSPIFFSENFIPDYNGTASLLIYPKYGNWHISDISVKPFATDNFNCSEFEIIIES